MIAGNQVTCHLRNLHVELHDLVGVVIGLGWFYHPRPGTLRGVPVGPPVDEGMSRRLLQIQLFVLDFILRLLIGR